MMMAARQIQPELHLSHLLAGGVALPAAHDPVVTGIALDSRMVQPGDLFLALRGSRADGREFIDAAIGKGAVAVIGESLTGARMEIRQRVPLIAMPDLRQRAGEIAARFHGNPSAAMRVIGITGTNGKTSCSHFLAQALDDLSPTGVIGTLGNGLFGDLEESGNTTPDPVSLQSWLARFRDQEVNDVVMEVSSHALEQGRVQGVCFAAALFTNLSRDHLDYHGSMARYGAAKRKLFSMPGLRRAIINADDKFGREMLGDLAKKMKVCGYTLEGRQTAARMVAGSELHLDSTGLQMKIRTPWGDGVLTSSLLGRFNASNLLAVLATLLMLDMPLERALLRLSRLAPVPGRMESFGGGRVPLVVVDYAHTPDALEQVLVALREHGGRLWCVFGCGGERDRGKRALMGAVAGRHADQVVITDDNPRSEEAAAIVNDILAGVPGYIDVEICHDRAAAITEAIRRASASDVVLVAGKGHEQFQQIGNQKYPFCDRDVVQRVLAERGSRNG